MKTRLSAVIIITIVTLLAAQDATPPAESSQAVGSLRQTRNYKAACQLVKIAFKIPGPGEQMAQAGQNAWLHQ